MTQPAYYLGRRMYVARPKSHPAIYVYTFVRQASRHGNVVTRLAKNDAFWRGIPMSSRARQCL